MRQHFTIKFVWAAVLLAPVVVAGGGPAFAAPGANNDVRACNHQAGQNRLVERTSPGDRLARRCDCRKRRKGRPRRRGTLHWLGRLYGSRRRRDARCIRPTGCEESSEETVIFKLVGISQQHRCARAASGHIAAAPSSVMNSRRFIRSPRRRWRGPPEKW